jgi:hypothetical protein
VILANNLINSYQGGCGSTVAIPAGSGIIYSEYQYNDTTWRTVTIPVNNLSANFQYLWFRINISMPLTAASILALDDLCIDDVTPATAPTSCFNFDDSIMGLPAYNQDPIDAFDSAGQPFQNWIVVNGSPSILTTGQGGFTAASGTQSLAMSACGSGNSEGAAYGYNFLAGHTYTITFANEFQSFAGPLNPPLDSFSVVLANGLVGHEQGGCGPTVAIPDSSDIIYNTVNYNDSIWHTDTITITPSVNFTYIWFRINIAQGLNVASNLVIDDFCITDQSALGINNIDQLSSAVIYPDPAIDLITLSTTQADKYSGITIVNMEGQQIDAPVVTHTDQSIQINTASLPSGQYILMLKGEGGTTVVKRFAIMK